MRLVSKQPANGKNYWIEDYTPEERDFFLSMGFTETDNSHIPKEFGISSTLQFQGSNVFGFWSNEEQIKINTSVVVYTGALLNIEQYDGNQ